MSAGPVDVGRLSTRAPAPSTRRWYTATVSESTARGVFVTEIDQDTATPSKLTWGATYRDTSTCSGDAHTHPLAQLPEGAIVLVVETDHGLWAMPPDLATLPTGGS